MMINVTKTLFLYETISSLSSTLHSVTTQRPQREFSLPQKSHKRDVWYESVTV